MQQRTVAHKYNEAKNNTSKHYRVRLAELLQEGRATQPEEHPLEAERVVLLADVADLGDDLAELRGREALHALGHVHLVLGVNVRVRDARGVATLNKLDRVEHAAHLQLVDHALAVQLLRQQLLVRLDAPHEVRLRRLQLGHERLERLDELGADRREGAALLPLGAASGGGAVVLRRADLLD